MVHICNPSTWRLMQEDHSLCVKGHPGLCSYTLSPKKCIIYASMYKFYMQFIFRYFLRRTATYFHTKTCK